MNNEQPNEGDTSGTEANTPVEKNGEDLKSPAQKLKEENDLLEKELERQKTIKEQQRHHELLSGNTGGQVKSEPKEVDPKDYVKQVMEGKIGDGKTA